MNLMIIHILTCLWIFFALLQNYEGTWMDPDYLEYDGPNQYLVSLYFIVTSFTTVGYGDVSIGNDLEKVFCIFLEMLGVIGFTTGTSTVTRLLYSYDV